MADTLLQTQMFPRLPARATFVADTNFVSETQKMFLILFRNILCPQQMFPSLRSMEKNHSFCVPRVCAPKKHYEQQCVLNNVSSFASTLSISLIFTHESFMLLSLLRLRRPFLCCRIFCSMFFSHFWLHKGRFRSGLGSNNHHA